MSWFIIHARLHGDDEDSLSYVEAPTVEAAVETVERELREADASPLCAACAAAGGDTAVTEDCTEGCLPFYLLNILECDSAPRVAAW